MPATYTREQLLANFKAQAAKTADVNEKQPGFSYGPGMDRQKYIDEQAARSVANAERNPQFGGYRDPNSHEVNGVTYPGPAQAVQPTTSIQPAESITPPAPVGGLIAAAPQPVQEPPPTPATDVVNAPTDVPNQLSNDQASTTPAQTVNNVAQSDQYSGNLWKSLGADSGALKKNQQLQQMGSNALQGLRSAGPSGLLY